MKIVIAFMAAVLCAVAPGVWAQSTVRPMAIVVTACGTAPSSLYVAGSQQFIVMDVNGNLCTNVTVTATATVAVAPLTSTNLASTVSVTNTFQSIQVATAGRNGCTVQNNDTNSMWVFFGAIGSATKAKSIVLAAGQAVSCAVGGLGVLTDQISITGTATGVYFAAVQ
jgi:hypothetical protein